MHLMYTIGPDGKRQYTLKKVVDGVVAKSAHPARFSPDDKYSRYAGQTWQVVHVYQRLTCLYRHRVTLKKRYGLLLTQQNGGDQKQAVGM